MKCFTTCMHDWIWRTVSTLSDYDVSFLSQTLYFLFKVRRARVIKCKPQGIYWPPEQGGRNEKKNKATSVYRLFLRLISIKKKTVHLQQSKGIKSSKQGLWKGHHLSLIEGIRNGYLFREKWYIKGWGVGFSGFSFLFSFWFAWIFSSVLACMKCFCFSHPSPSFNCFNCPFLKQQASDENITNT